MGERELEGIKSEMGKLADMLEDSDEDLDAGAVADILRELSGGMTADAVVAEFGLEVNTGGL